MTDERAAVEELVAGMYGAFVAGDTSALERCLHPDATVWDVFTPDLVVGAAARARFHVEDQAQKQARGALQLHVEPALVDVHGDVAWARYVVDFRYAPPQPLAGRARVTDVLLRGPQGWRVVHHHEGLVPAPRA
jgi:ketosteroid isomerase-like protein